MEPSICLDSRSPFLGLARLTGDVSLAIEAQRISPDDQDYVLVSSNTYVSNCLDPISQKVMIVQSGFYDTLKWSLPIVSAQGEQVANAAY